MAGRHSKARAKNTMAFRRKQVAALLESGDVTQRDIADAIGVSTSTVNRDIAALREEWRQESVDSIDTVMVTDLHRLEVALSSVWLRVVAGELYAVDRFLKIVELRAKLLGYEPPKRVAIDATGHISLVEVVLATDEEGVITAEAPSDE